MNTDADLIQRLGRSNLYTEFKQAFGASTGLPLTPRPLEFWQLAHRGQPRENPFYAMIAQTNRGCSAYLEAEQRAVVCSPGPGGYGPLLCGPVPHSGAGQTRRAYDRLFADGPGRVGLAFTGPL